MCLTPRSILKGHGLGQDRLEVHNTTAPTSQVIHDLQFLQFIDPYVLRAAVQFKKGSQLRKVVEFDSQPFVFSQNHKAKWSTKSILKPVVATTNNSSGMPYADEGRDDVLQSVRLVRFRRTVKVGWTWPEGTLCRNSCDKKKTAVAKREIKSDYAEGLLLWTEEDDLIEFNTDENEGEGRKKARMAAAERFDTSELEEVDSSLNGQDDLPSPGSEEGYVDEDGFMCYDTREGEVEEDSAAEQVLDMYQDEQEDEKTDETFFDESLIDAWSQHGRVSDEDDSDSDPWYSDEDWNNDDDLINLDASDEHPSGTYEEDEDGHKEAEPEQEEQFSALYQNSFVTEDDSDDSVADPLSTEGQYESDEFAVLSETGQTGGFLLQFEEEEDEDSQDDIVDYDSDEEEELDATSPTDAGIVSVIETKIEAPFVEVCKTSTATTSTAAETTLPRKRSFLEMIARNYEIANPRAYGPYAERQSTRPENPWMCPGADSIVCGGF